ncbi:MAG: hypothetical protein R2827_06110 [Bdellovibrionales bacterium]
MTGETTKRLRRISVGICLFLVSCGGKPNKSSDISPANFNRSFNMGFTTWPYAATFEAVDRVYSTIDSEGDLIAHHLDGGIPWPEALTQDNFDNYGQNVKDDILSRVNRTSALSSDTKVYLGVSPFSSLRDGLALYWKDGVNEPLPSPWDSLSIGNDFVIAAYSNFLDELIERLNPDYVNYAIEANEYYHNLSTDSERLEFIKFISYVYTFLKSRHPEVQFMTSFVLTDPGSGKMLEAKELFLAIKDYHDLIGVSVYPYAFFSHTDKGDPKNLPADWLSQITNIAPNKSYFVAETGFIAENLSIPSIGLNAQSDPNKQAEFVRRLMLDANAIQAKGIVWYSSHDFDDLWAIIPPPQQDLALIWRDTGLYDENLDPRLSLDIWREWMSFSIQ